MTSFLNRPTGSSMPPDNAFRPILEIADELGIEHGPSGAGWHRAVCPIPGHNDTDPSLRFNVRGNWYICMGCNAAGNPAYLYRDVTGCTLEAAIAATVRGELDGLDDLPRSLDESAPAADTTRGLIAVTRMLAERVGALSDTVDVDNWMAALYDAGDDEALLRALRAVA